MMPSTAAGLPEPALAERAIAMVLQPLARLMIDHGLQLNPAITTRIIVSNHCIIKIGFRLFHFVLKLAIFRTGNNHLIVPLFHVHRECICNRAG